MPIPVLTTKLYAPPPRPDEVLRPELLQKLDHGLRTGRQMTLVSAPAGFGKTTLVSQWLAEMQNAKCKMQKEACSCADPYFAFCILHSPSMAAWLSLDADDNDPARFLTYLVAALRAAQPDLGQPILGLLASPALPAVEALMALLLNELAAAALPTVLVLDDYHWISAEPIHRAVQYLLDHQPPTLHLVLITRADPPLAIPRLRVRGQLSEIRSDDLRFTLQEAGDFLAGTMALDIGQEAIRALEQRTEGWIAGLRLAALSMEGWAAPRVAAFVATFSGSHRYVIDYLLDEVMQRQPAPIRNFLYQTAILDRFCAPLCDAIMRAEGEGLRAEGVEPQPSAFSPSPSAFILRELERANLLLVPLDDQHEWYRYHHLFADFLRTELQREPTRVAELHRRAARWFGQQGMLAEAVRHAVAAGDAAWAADLIESGGTAAWARADVSLFALIGELPREIVAQRPWLCIFHAWSLQLTGRLGGVEAYFQDAEAHLDMIARPGEARAIRSYIAIIRAFLLEMRGVASDIPAEMYQGIAEIPDTFIAMRYGAIWASGFVAYLSGDFVRASRLLFETVRHGEASGMIGVIPICLAKLGAIGIASGELRATAQLMDGYLQLVNRHGPHSVWLAGLINLVLAQILIEQNDLAQAAEQIAAGLENLDLWGVPYAVALGLATQAQLCLAQGDLAGADAALTRAEAIRSAVQIHPDISSLITHLRVRQLIAGGATASGKRTLPGRCFRHELDNLTLARLWLAQGQLAEAEALLAAQAEDARAGGRAGRLAQILVLRALALAQMPAPPGDPLPPLPLLAEALAISAPEGALRVFLDEGPTLAALLERMKDETGRMDEGGRMKEYLHTLLAAFGSQGAVHPASLIPHPLIELLSDQELNVLRLLAAGHSNQAIADQLIIGLGTAKWHVHNLFNKLDVTSRTQAVARARELGFIA